MKWEKYAIEKNLKSEASNPSKLVQDYLNVELANGGIVDFFKDFDFESREELERALKDLFFAIAGDKYVSNKLVQENDIRIKSLFKRFNDIVTHFEKFEKTPKTMAASLFASYFTKKILKKNVDKLFSRFEKEVSEKIGFDEIAKEIKDIYGITDNDVMKLRFFFAMAKDESFPNSLRRMLYLWSKEKMTGKTTVGKMIVAILNGSRNWDVADFSSSLGYEMQMSAYAVPKISEYNCVLLDECFYKDMSKTYDTFKRFITSADGTARLPYGQEFQWFGKPNYVATSNRPLKEFIKDWNDRRFLSVELKNTKQVSFGKLYEIWFRFILLCEKPKNKSWREWADEEILDIAEETGEQEIISSELEIELKRKLFIDSLLAEPWSERRSDNQNRIPLKFFIDFFGKYDPTVRNRRSEVSEAVRKVFGEPKKNGVGVVWNLLDLREIASGFANEIEKNSENMENLPF